MSKKDIVIGSQMEDKWSKKDIVIGSHIHKFKTLRESLRLRYEVEGVSFECPSQIFTRPTQRGSHSITQDDLTATHEYIKKHSISLFIHTVYIINLSNPWTKKDLVREGLGSLSILKSDLEIGKSIGSKGVVVHVGKHTKLSKDEGLRMMEESIRKVLPSATPQCPLLIETPAGEGTELCVTIEDFTLFYNRFNHDEKKILKIVIDTAHIWAADYEPIEYITQWESLHGAESIALIHLNDSRREKNSRVDRHAPIGMGFIGMEKMSQVIIWATTNSVPMVTE